MDRPKVIIFRANIKELYQQAGITDKDFDQWPAEIILCESFKGLSQFLEQEPVLIIAAQDLIRKYGSMEEFLLMVDTMVKFSGQDKKPAIGIGFCQEISHEEIKQAQKNGLSLFPSIVSYGLKEMVMSVNSFLTTGRSWPKHIIDQLVGNKEQPKFKDIHLTARQKQVYDLIARRGLTNKQIAQVLKISESTVKIHVSAVMRALCVRNRTQLALTK